MRKAFALAFAISAATPALAQTVITRSGDTQFYQGRGGYEGTSTDAGGTTFYQDRHGHTGTCTDAGGTTFCNGSTPYSNE